MTFYVERETDIELLSDTDKEDDESFLRLITEAAAAHEACPYDVSVNLLITDGASIRAINREFRDIDSETDVLSFPAVDFDEPADFSHVEEDPSSYMDPETDELMLGDIMLNAERVISQAKEYGHSIRREYAFLLTHSLLHLMGYDHETKEQEEEMFRRQDEILKQLGIER